MLIKKKNVSHAFYSLLLILMWEYVNNDKMRTCITERSDDRFEIAKFEWMYWEELRLFRKWLHIIKIDDMWNRLDAMEFAGNSDGRWIMRRGVHVMNLKLKQQADQNALIYLHLSVQNEHDEKKIHSIQLQLNCTMTHTHTSTFWDRFSRLE